MKIINKSWNELDIQKSTVIIGIAPIEEHGRHLPTGVDYFLTQRWMADTAKRLEKELDINIYTLPVIPIGCSYMRGFPGNLYVSQMQVYKTTKDILSSIMDWGIKKIIIISAHADPKHQIAIEQACEHMNKNDIISFSPMGAIFSANELGMEINYSDKVQYTLKDYPNDFHAGWIETSLMLYYDSNMVRNNYHDTENIILQVKDMMFSRLVNEKIADHGHIGYPRLANADLGEELHNSMIDMIYEASSRFIARDEY